MKILLTGAGGMLGKTLARALEARGHFVKGLSRAELDITNYTRALDLFKYAKPHFVIHAAAYTKVDQAESEPDLAYLVNGYGTENVAVACNLLDVPLLYISTDYVFGGEQNQPYTTWDQPAPLSVYGKSKLAGEKAVERLLSRFYIVRTSWLYGPHGKNFVETILKLASEKDVLRVVSDQWGSPTCTLTLSEYLADLIETGRWGVYHATDGGITNWHEFARAILSGHNVRVEPLATTDMPRPATRPKYSVLDKSTLIKTIGHDLVHWGDALHRYMSVRENTAAV